MELQSRLNHLDSDTSILFTRVAQNHSEHFSYNLLTQLKNILPNYNIFFLLFELLRVASTAFFKQIAICATLVFT